MHISLGPRGRRQAYRDAGAPGRRGSPGTWRRKGRPSAKSWSGCGSSLPPVTWRRTGCRRSRSPGCSAIRSPARSSTPSNGGTGQRPGEGERALGGLGKSREAMRCSAGSRVVSTRTRCPIFPAPVTLTRLAAIIVEASHQPLRLRLVRDQYPQRADRFHRWRWQPMHPYLPFAITVVNGSVGW
jgi:hypothetical protein